MIEGREKIANLVLCLLDSSWIAKACRVHDDPSEISILLPELSIGVSAIAGATWMRGYALVKVCDEAARLRDRVPTGFGV